MTTFSFAAFLIVTLAGHWVIGAWLLKFGLWISKAGKQSLKPTLITVALVGLINTTIVLSAAGVASVLKDDHQVMLVALFGFLLGLAANLKAIRFRHSASTKQAVVAFVIMQFAGIPNLLLAEGIIKPYWLEAFRANANSMAPTVCGDHLELQCPQCGGALIVSSTSLNQKSEQGICRKCLRVSAVPLVNKTVHTGDRILACKFLKPRRWDLVVFRYPEDPSVVYIKRLVGLPRETIAIRDSEIWINGEQVAKPPELKGLEYVADPVRQEQTEWGPVELGDDESFVLGDFSVRSKDSRMWEIGADGHPAYAVPDSHLLGVATHIYWPPSRWRIFR